MQKKIDESQERVIKQKLEIERKLKLIEEKKEKLKQVKECLENNQVVMA